MLSASEENEVVARVKYGDSEAITILIQKYRPLIFNMMNRYQIHLYDLDDWLQEARLECYLTAQKFDPSTGSKFGSFYKLRLQNRMITKIRKQMAQKRNKNGRPYSLDNILVSKNESLPDSLKTGACISECLGVDLQAYIETLSFVEIQALMVNLGQKTSEQVQSLNNIHEHTLKNAQQRVRIKLRNHLRSEFGVLDH